MTHSPQPSALAARTSDRWRTVQQPATGSQKNSSLPMPFSTRPCAVPEVGRGIDLVFYAARLVFAEEAAGDGPAPDPVPGESGGGMVRPGRVQLAAAVGRRRL